MTVFYELAMSQSIFHELLCISIFFFYRALYMMYSVFSLFSEVAILAAFNVLIISSTRPSGAFTHTQPTNNVFHSQIFL